MEEKFQKQIQRVQKLRQLHEEMRIGDNAQIAAYELEIEKRKNLELKKFKEHVQNNFLEYFLNLFEEYTSTYGKVREIRELRIRERRRDVRLIGVQLPKALSGRIFLDNDDEYLYLYHSLFYEELNPSLRVHKRVDMEFSRFYSDYVTQEELAHVIIPDFSKPNSHHFKLASPHFKLCIEDLDDLFFAVCVNHEYTEKKYRGNDDCWPSEDYFCDLGNQMSVSLHILRDYNEGTLRDMAIKL